MSWAPPRISTIVARASKWAQPQKIVLQVGAPQALNCYDVHRSSLKQFLKEQSKTIRTEKQLLLAVFSLGKSSQVPTPTGWQLSKQQPGVFCCCLSSAAVVCCFDGVSFTFFWKSKQIGAYWFRKLTLQSLSLAVVILLCVFNANCWIFTLRRDYIVNFKEIIIIIKWHQCRNKAWRVLHQPCLVSCVVRANDLQKPLLIKNPRANFCGWIQPDGWKNVPKNKR